MNTPIFLFHGGMYKRGLDDERLRVPLNPMEIDLLQYDPHLPRDTDNSLSSELDMSQYGDLFCNLTVGDEIYVALLPDNTVYRGLWAGAFNVVNGFRVVFDVVRMRDVWDDFVANGTPSKALPAVPGTPVLEYDFSDGLGHTPEDAFTQTRLPWGLSYENYRNNAALKWVPFNPAFFTALGEAMYIRMTIVELGDMAAIDDGICCTCKKPKYPVFQVGATCDRICFDKLRHQKYCNCAVGPCRGGCDGESIPGGGGAAFFEVGIDYVDATGELIAESHTVTIREGETATIVPIDVAGYTAPAPITVTLRNGRLTDSAGRVITGVRFQYTLQ